MSTIPTPAQFTPEDFARLREIRAHHPEQIARALSERRQRHLLTDGRLFIIAADHPARGALGVGDDPLAMANRYDLLNRLAYALSHPGVDGVLATADVVDDLAVLGALENKVVVGSLNRGGLQHSVFEMDDRLSAYDLDSIQRQRLDFAKTLLRIDLQDPGTLTTLTLNREAVNRAHAAGIPIMIEPFITVRTEFGCVNQLTAPDMIRAIAIATGLGSSSAYTWLKIPVVPQMERVMQSTTLPTLILGGEVRGDQQRLYRRWEHAMTLPGVRGLVVGRSLLYPPDGDLGSAITTAASLVHGTEEDF